MWRKRKHIVWLMPFDRPFGDTSGEHSQCASVWDTKWYDITIQSADLVKLRCSESALTICTYQICDVLLCMVCDVWCLIFGPIIVLLAFIFDYHMFHDSDMKYLYLPECVYIYTYVYVYVLCQIWYASYLYLKPSPSPQFLHEARGASPKKDSVPGSQLGPTEDPKLAKTYRMGPLRDVCWLINHDKSPIDSTSLVLKSHFVCRNPHCLGSTSLQDDRMRPLGAISLSWKEFLWSEQIISLQWT